MKPEKNKENQFGFMVVEITQDDVTKFKLESSNGVIIQKVIPGSIADQSELSEGMVVVEIDRQPVKSVAEFNNIIEGSNVEKGILLLVVSEGNARYLNLKKQN
jgi:serine protease Do